MSTNGLQPNQPGFNTLFNKMTYAKIVWLLRIPTLNKFRDGTGPRMWRIYKDLAAEAKETPGGTGWNHLDFLLR